MERRASGSEFLNWIKSGRSKDGLSESEIAAGIKKAEPGTYEHAFKHTLDTLLSSQFGKRYAKADQIKEMIGRAMGATGSAGRKIKGLGELGNAKKAFEPYEWTKDYLNTIATGNKKAREAVIAREKKALIKAGKDADAKLTDAEISELGLEAGVEGGGFKGFKVENIMLEDKIKNMSRGDQKFMPGLTSMLLGGSKNTGSGAIRKGVEDARNVMQFLVSSHSKYVAAGKKPAAGKETRMNQYISLMPERGFTGRWANLSKEKKAEVTDKTNTYFDDIFKKYKKKFETSEAKVVPVEKNIAKLENDIKKAEERLQVEPQERSNWETDEFLISNINTMKNEVSKLKSTLKKAIQDGGGGPGLYDGAGGPKWDWLKSKVGSAKTALSKKWKKLGESSSSTVYPSDNKPRTSKYKNPVTRTDTGEPKGPSYNPIKPTARRDEIKKRIGKFVNPVQRDPVVEGAKSGVDTSPDSNFPGGYKEIKKGVFNAPERRTEEVNQFVPPQYAEPLSNAARRHGVDENGLAAMVQTESSWNPNATNPESSATGFGQIVDGTYEYIKKNYKDFDRLNPSEALDAMAWYLQDVGKRVGSNNFTEQVKAYYMGPAAYNDRYSPRWAERLRNAEAHVDRMSRFL